MGTPYTNNQNNNTLQIAEMLGSRHIALQDVKNNQGQTVRIYEFEGEEGKRDIEVMLEQLD